MEKSQMIANKSFRRYFDFAQYDKTGIFTQPVSTSACNWTGRFSACPNHFAIMGKLVA
jgi:hypothetical protein